MTEEHPIEGLMTTAMQNLQKMVEVNTIIGDPIKSPDGSLIIPVSKLGFGFAAGGSEFHPSQAEGNSDATLPFGGGSGGGVSITPVAFLIVSEQGVKMVHLDQNTHLYEKMLDFAPQVIEKVQQIINDTSGSKKEGKADKTNPSHFDI
ncbi:GerW family sporulation protein [Oceanobacillus saliphilus]|uniref:GerW family sporulation protein n=1 Tax=Oceanobacillus saliphilus TaxID=2925834 RepID=UPI00201DF39E|nr:GerW family sporulation protein [Oceanobacillus saliphilus]